jgi:hypothetical protein
MPFNTPTYLPQANPGDVIGQLLVGIDQCFEQSKSGIDFAWNFYRLGSGLVLTLGFDDGDNDTQYKRAVPIGADRLKNVINHRIESAWQLPEDPDFSAYALRMENGLYLVELYYAMEGTGPPGVCVLEQDKLTWELTRLW